METQGFLSMFQGYWPQAKNVKAPKQQELWTETIDGIPDDVLAYAMKRYARSAKYPPTVVEFEKFLWPLMDAWAARHPESALASEWLRRQDAWRKSAEDDHLDPIIRGCDGCGATIRHEVSQSRPPMRFETDGGLVYKLGEGGKWYACRCPLCGGPCAHRPYPKARTNLARFCAPNSLPVPSRDEWAQDLWKPLSQTPGGPLRDTIVAERVLKPEDPRFIACYAWQREAIDNSRAKIEAKIAEEQAAYEAEERERRIAAMNVAQERRETAKAAAEPTEEQAVMLMDPPDLGEPSPDAADSAPDEDDTVPF